MKKIILALIILSSMVCACACGHADENETLEVSVENVCGTWEQEAEQDVIGMDIEPATLPLTVVMTFNVDMTCVINFDTPPNDYGLESRTVSGRYSINDDEEKITLTIFYSETSKDIFDVTVTKNELILDGHGIKYELTRVK